MQAPKCQLKGDVNSFSHRIVWYRIVLSYCGRITFGMGPRGLDSALPASEPQQRCCQPIPVLMCLSGAIRVSQGAVEMKMILIK